MDARRANDRIAEKAQRLQFVSRVPMLCECRDPACRTIVMVALDEFRRIRESDGIVLASGHDPGRDAYGDRRSA